MSVDIVGQRMHAQLLAHRTRPAVVDVVRRLGAVQAQDYLGALWAIGARSPGTKESDVEDALRDRSIIRSWPMRGTLHFIAAEDARAFIEVLSPAIVKSSARRNRQLALDDDTFARARTVLTKVLRAGKPLSRPKVYAALADGKVSPAGQRGIHILWRLSQEQLICFGPREGKQQTFVLLDEWIGPRDKKHTRDDALAMVALRYFTGHGPATLRDFSWWTGLSLGDARAAHALVASSLERVSSDGVELWFAPPASKRSATGAHLLPAFDEYLVGYQDRSAVLVDKVKLKVNAGGGLLKPVAVIDGHVIGTWQRTLKRNAVAVVVAPFTRLSKVELRALEEATDRYGAFLALPASLTVA